jgi:PAS domain S-box-containing protein
MFPGDHDEILGLVVDITERKRAEEALHASEESYRRLFNSIDEGFCVIEKVEDEASQPFDFRFVEANPAFAIQSGASDVVGKTIRQEFLEEAEEWLDIYGTILRTGESIRFERGFKGHVLELYAFLIEDGTNCRIAVIFKDITNRKLAEDALHESENRFKILSEANALLLSSKDPEAMIQTIAEKVMRHLKCEVFFNYVFDKSQGRLHLNAYGGTGAEEAKKIEWLDEGVAVCGCVARNGCRISDRSCKRCCNCCQQYGFGSEVHLISVGCSCTIYSVSFYIICCSGRNTSYIDGKITNSGSPGDFVI